MTPVTPPAGVSAAGTWTPVEFVDPESPPAHLADWIDPRTGDFASLLTGIDPVDSMVQLALTIERGTGAAVTDVGHRFRTVKKVDDSTPSLLRSLTEEALSSLLQRKLIRIEKLDVEADPDGDLGAVFLAYSNLLSGTRRELRVAVG
ncbi:MULTISPECIES: hypothetical protein [Sorangium]|uniref:Uncharacterized protein n=1 Tax=Sorangium cellulosum TaxID=56 RepID=A0A4P2QP60_SORCE|nr:MULTISPECIES: hypothetical protein [Sorangium]AUX31919.1 uncharacterized protein SOCE836_040540 [Sorangium cellulosum]WCQ91293.1 hypothetical protein NQZ70_04009 [Sorangium sp. Soce836]